MPILFISFPPTLSLGKLQWKYTSTTIVIMSHYAFDPAVEYLDLTNPEKLTKRQGCGNVELKDENDCDEQAC